MKRNISDLLDTYYENSVDPDSGTPLSSARIKELTMRKIAPEKSHKKYRAPMRLLAAAAIVAALSVSAFAADSAFGAGTLLQNFFAKEDGSLTSSQLAVMDQMGRTFEGGVTSNGATITPIAALADENVYYLRLRIEAPEGVVLPDLDPEVDGYYQLFDAGSGQIELTWEENAYQSHGWNLRTDWLPDDDPTDNRKEVVLQYIKQTGTDLCFNDGVSKTLTIHGLWIQNPDKEYTPVFTGEFTFDIGLYYESKIVSLDCEGITWTNETYGYTNMLERLELSPLSLYYGFRSTMAENDWIYPGVGGNLQIMMKDGTVFWSAYRGASSADTDEIKEAEEDPRFNPASYVCDTFVSSCEDYVLFDEPLDLTQVAYIQYGEHQIPVEVD